ncbi:MAG: SH3 domain-containing protein, partial [Clostridia bacterium]|nr:SH3 domain-containing protein [Clostridia bacterium]
WVKQYINNGDWCKVSDILTVTWSRFASTFSTLDYAYVYKNFNTEYSNNTLTINYNVNGGTILSDILSYDYKVTEEIGINMRDSAGTSGTKLTALPKGTTFTVKSDEIKTADGYTWGKTTYKEYTGWVVISDFVEQTGVSRTARYYAQSDLVYESASSSLLNDNNQYGVYNNTGLYDAATFGLVREGYDFVGWSFTPTGEEIIYQDTGFKPEEIVPELENGSLTVTVYAIWRRNVKLNIMFNYDANGGTGEMSGTIGIEGANVAFDANTFVKDGYDFAGWQIQRADGKWYIEEYGWCPIDLIDERGYTITTYADGAEIALDSAFVTLDYDFTCILRAVWVEKPEPVASFEIKSISHVVLDDRVIFTVTTTPDFNRVKVTSVENLASYISYSSNYVVNADGDYVFTLSVPAVEGVSQYAFDGRRVDTNKYAKGYAYIQFEIEETTPTIINVTHEFSNDKIIFTVITKPGDFGRMKVTTADALSGSLGVASTYTVNSDGNYVWIIKAAEPEENTKYAFDLRNAETGKYLKDYSYYEVEAATPTILSVGHTVSDGKIVFTVVTKAGNFSRIKVTNAINLGGSLGVANTYTVDENGNYVWTINAAEPKDNMNYAFDLRNSQTGKYLKEYFYYDVEASTPDILNVIHATSGGKMIFTVTTKAGGYDRIKATLADNLGGSIAVATSYTIDANGNYVWTIKAPLYDATSYAFDLRVAGGRYQKDYFLYNI